MAAAASLLPVLAILVLMLGLRWGAGPAGLAGLAVALPVAVLGFGWGDAAGAVGVAAEAGFGALTILWIVYPALLLHEVQMATGATGRIRAALARLSDDPRLVALLIAWFFGLFAEGAAGFGTPVALAAPLLVAFGFEPVRAVALALVGHAAGVAFGAVGTPVQPLVAASGLDPLVLSGAIGLLMGATGWVLAVATQRLAAVQGDDPALGWALAAAGFFLVPAMAIAWFVGPELPTLGGALAGGAGFALVLRLRGERGRDGSPMEARALAAAAAPYLLLLALILASRLVPAVQGVLAGWEWRWSLAGGFEGRIAPLYHPGTLLLVATLGAVAWRGDGGGVLREAAGRAAGRLQAVLLALLAMLLLARLMVHAGMVAALAAGAAGLIGGAWPLLAPAAGALGTFVTGSATASNILLGDLQRATAQALGLPVLAMAAAQAAGAAVGNVVCPHNVVAGAATVGLRGRETGTILRLTLPAFAGFALLAGVLVLAVARFG